MSTNNGSPKTPVNHAPKGCRHKIKPFSTRPPRPTSILSTEERKSRIAELAQLPEYVKTNLPSWSDKEPQEFQLDAIRATHLGEDAVVHASTGSGKTFIAAAPHFLPSNQGKGKVTLLVSPLIALHEEQVVAFQDEFKLTAIAVNSAQGEKTGCSAQKMKEKSIIQQIVSGKWQIVIVSPEMLQTRRFIEGVLRKPDFAARCISVFIDEAHCVSHWGAGFRKKYGTIGTIRVHLWRSTPFIAVSATLTARVRYDILDKLQFNPNNYRYINIGNDRPNVAQVVRSIEHPLKSFADLDFVIPPHVSAVTDIPKTMIYFDDTSGGADMVDYLNSRVADQFKHLGLVRPYNAAMSSTYRKRAMKLFRAGVLRVLVCTDAAGMGCNIPDIDIVVQWKAPKTLSSWVQRAGRVARGRGRKGIAVMLVEKSAFQVDPTSALASSEDDSGSLAGASQSRGGRGRRGGKKGRRGNGQSGGGSGHGAAGPTRRLTLADAVLRGLKRGSCSGKDDAVLVRNEPILTENAPLEGLYIFVQTTECRRRFLSKVFQNVPPVVSAAECCDLCNPTLFNRVRGGRPLKVARQAGIKRHDPLPNVREALYEWRREAKRKHFPRARWAPHALLDNDTCELLACVHPLANKAVLEKLLKPGWAHWTDLSDELFACLSALPARIVPVLTEHPSSTTATPSVTAHTIQSTTQPLHHDSRGETSGGRSHNDTLILEDSASVQPPKRALDASTITPTTTRRAQKRVRIAEDPETPLDHLPSPSKHGPSSRSYASSQGFTVPDSRQMHDQSPRSLQSTHSSSPPHSNLSMLPPPLSPPTYSISSLAPGSAWLSYADSQRDSSTWPHYTPTPSASQSSSLLRDYPDLLSETPHRTRPAPTRKRRTAAATNSSNGRSSLVASYSTTSNASAQSTTAYYPSATQTQTPHTTTTYPYWPTNQQTTPWTSTQPISHSPQSNNTLYGAHNTMATNANPATATHTIQQWAGPAHLSPGSQHHTPIHDIPTINHVPNPHLRSQASHFQPNEISFLSPLVEPSSPATQQSQAQTTSLGHPAHPNDGTPWFSTA